DTPLVPLFRLVHSSASPNFLLPKSHTAAEAGIVFGDEMYLLKRDDRIVMPFNVACDRCLNYEEGKHLGRSRTRKLEGMSQSDPTLEDKRKTFAFRSPTSTPWFFSLVRSMRKILLHLQMFPNGDDMALNIPDSAPVNPRRSHAAVLRGDSEMYVIDRVPERLPKTKEIGCMPIDFSASDPVHQIKALRGGKEVDRGVAGTCS
ncbi:hypothetical protein B0H19DRAFT_1167721, partial [Mycena capillaripes]